MSIDITPITATVRGGKITTWNGRATMALTNGFRLEYSRRTDGRVLDAEDGKIWTKSEKAAESLAGELRAWGLPVARALGCAVVFWEE